MTDRNYYRVSCLVLTFILGFCLMHIYYRHKEITQLTQERDECQVEYARYWLENGKVGRPPTLFITTTFYDTLKQEAGE